MNATKHGWPTRVVIAMVSVFAAWPVGAPTAQTVPPGLAAKAAQASQEAAEGAKGHLIDRQSVYAFLAAAKQAEALDDPLQRCLKYPDPPGSHWSPKVVDAYCRYRVQPIAPYEQIRGLLQRGEFDELERRLAVLLQDKLTKPEKRNILDAAYVAWFNRSDLELRPLLENWKQAKPKSAFAYAASGTSYVAMAEHARGNQYIRDTPASSIEAMDRLVELADADLRRAVQLDARVTPAYTAMIDAGRYSKGDAYFQQASQAGLRADPANFRIYDRLMWALQPKWGGSQEQMNRLAEMAKKHGAENPTLLVLPEKALAEAADLDSDDCKNTDRFAQFSVIFDQVAVPTQLLRAGTVAAECRRLELAVVYNSEALRFNPDDDNRVNRANELNDFDESAWALKEVEGVVQRKPHVAYYVLSRGYANESLNHYEAAEKDYQAALALDPGNKQAYQQLVRLYSEGMHDWDKLWKLDERMVELFPNEPYVWLLRAHIQQRQPRPGLKDTADYFAAHFDKSPETHKELLKMRAAQALEEGKVRAAAKTAGP